MPEGNITLDQFLGRHSAGATRFPVLNTAAGPMGGGGVELSWTKNGVMVPPLQQVTRVFQMLFVDDPEDQQAQRARQYQEQGSILDSVNAQARAMERRLDTVDRQKLDQYFTSIREVEKAIAQEKAWLTRPRPSVEMKEPKNGTVSQQLPIHHLNLPGTTAGQCWVMGDDEAGRPLRLVDALQKLKNIVGAAGVQVACGLVGQD
jgi:hypothetical protein